MEPVGIYCSSRKTPVRVAAIEWYKEKNSKVRFFLIAEISRLVKQYIGAPDNWYGRRVGSDRFRSYFTFFVIHVLDLMCVPERVWF